MTIRRGFEVKPGEKYLVCEDIITTGGSALEAAREIVKVVVKLWLMQLFSK